ncbi:unnamed protein product [Brassica oleracea var. botrytis]
MKTHQQNWCSSFIPRRFLTSYSRASEGILLQVAETFPTYERFIHKARLLQSKILVNRLQVHQKGLTLSRAEAMNKPSSGTIRT